MVKGRDEGQWIHTAQLICAVYNCNRSRGDTLVKFADVYPYYEHEEIEAPADLDGARAAWTRGVIKRGGD